MLGRIVHTVLTYPSAHVRGRGGAAALVAGGVTRQEATPRAPREVVAAPDRTEHLRRWDWIQREFSAHPDSATARASELAAELMAAIGYSASEAEEALLAPQHATLLEAYRETTRLYRSWVLDISSAPPPFGAYREVITMLLLTVRQEHAVGAPPR